LEELFLNEAWTLEAFAGSVSRSAALPAGLRGVAGGDAGMGQEKKELKELSLRS
jgi:hypothetical protein